MAPQRHLQKSKYIAPMGEGPTSTLSESHAVRHIHSSCDAQQKILLWPRPQTHCLSAILVWIWQNAELVISLTSYFFYLLLGRLTKRAVDRCISSRGMGDQKLSKSVWCHLWFPVGGASNLTKFLAIFWKQKSIPIRTYKLRSNPNFKHLLTLRPWTPQMNHRDNGHNSAPYRATWKFALSCKN